MIDYRRIEELAGEAQLLAHRMLYAKAPVQAETAEDLSEDDMRAGISELGTG
ncbi:MAG: hypothetical protein IPO38_06245 [Rhodocyclaceae bacterium]|nr:hypothetical protein [Rhodocyclaceae bacterium]